MIFYIAVRKMEMKETESRERRRGGERRGRAGKEERGIAGGTGIKRARQGNEGRKQSRGDGSVYKAFV